MESRIKVTLYQLIHSSVPDFNIKEIDEIVTSYVESILEELVAEDRPEEILDTEAFQEMMVAYLPQSELIKETKMTDWVLQLVDELKAERSAKELPSLDIKMIISETTSPRPSAAAATTSSSSSGSRKVRSVSETSLEGDNKKRGRCARLSETSEAGSDMESELEAGVATLLEMFPSCCQVEAVHCLTVMNGDLEGAAQLLITRAEIGQDIRPSQAQLLAQLSKPKIIDDSQLKKKIMEQYGFVDKEEDSRYHRPNISKKYEDKKLIRYREGKIVSTKGERFTQVTKEECQEMKKNIKI